MSLNASTVMVVTEMGSVRKPRHREGKWLCPVTQHEAGCAGTCHQPIRVQTLDSHASALLHRGREQSDQSVLRRMSWGVRTEILWALSTGPPSQHSLCERTHPHSGPVMEVRVWFPLTNEDVEPQNL